MVADKQYTWPLFRHVTVAFRVPQGPLGRAGKVRDAHLIVRWCDGYGSNRSPDAVVVCTSHSGKPAVLRPATAGGFYAPDAVLGSWRAISLAYSVFHATARERIPIAKGERYDKEFMVTVQNDGSGLTHEFKGRITGKVD